MEGLLTNEDLKKGMLNNYKLEHLYITEFHEKKGKYMTYVFEKEEELAISSKIAMRLTYLSNNDKLEGLKITRIENGAEKECMTFSKFDISHLNAFLEFIKSLNLPELTNNRIKLADDFKLNSENQEAITSILNSKEGIDFLKNFLTNENLTNEDLVNLSYRKQQLDLFGQMLKEIHTEPEWQKFFEKNHWIFGYGLDFIFTESLIDSKLEQYTNGSNFNEAGFEVDALLKTKGAINSICLCEIKRPDTKLLSSNPKRTDVWHINSSLYEAVSQIQKNVFRFQEKFETTIKRFKNNGDPTGEELYLIKPKSYLVVGTLNQFKTEQGVNLSKFSSFELFRKNLIAPEIITFDELYERAKAIVNNNEINTNNEVFYGIL